MKTESTIKHIAIIMDGNRRWAKEHNLPSAVGHKKGVSSLRETVRACDELGIKYLTVYAFSTENWLITVSTSMSLPVRKRKQRRSRG